MRAVRERRMLPRNDEPPSTDERPDDDAPGLQAANPATERGVSKLDLRLFHPLSSAKMPTNPPLSSKDERGVDAWCVCCVDVCQPKCFSRASTRGCIEVL